MQNKKNIIVALVAGIALLFLIGGGYYLFFAKEGVSVLKQPMPIADFEAKSASIVQLRNSGEYEQALGVVREVLVDKTLVDADKEWFRFMEGVLTNNIGGSANRFEAISIWRGLATDANVGPVARASAINSMTGNYFSDFDSDVFDAIFANGGSEWTVFTPGLSFADKKLAITKISEYSYGLYPSADALFASNYWYMGQLTSESSLVTAAQKTEYLSILKNNLVKIDSLIASEAARDGSVDHVKIHRRGFPEGVVAVYGEGSDRQVFAEKFQATYAQAEAAFEGRTASGYDGINLGKNIPYTYFYHAAFLDKFYGPARTTEVNVLLNKLAEHIRTGKGTNNFITFMQEQKNKSIAERDHNYAFFVALSNASPTFKSMLNENGWVL